MARKLLKMEAPGRVELPTNGLGNRCSIHLSYGANASCFNGLAGLCGICKTPPNPSMQGHAVCTTILTTLPFSSRFAPVEAPPYQFIVVDVWAGRINFCYTLTGASASSKSER